MQTFSKDLPLLLSPGTLRESHNLNISKYRWPQGPYQGGPSHPSYSTLLKNSVTLPTQYTLCSSTFHYSPKWSWFRPSSSHQDYPSKFLIIIHVFPTLTTPNWVSSSKTQWCFIQPTEQAPDSLLKSLHSRYTFLLQMTCGTGEIIYLLWASVSFLHCVVIGTVAQVAHCTSMSFEEASETKPNSYCSYQIHSLVWGESESGQRRDHPS